MASIVRTAGLAGIDAPAVYINCPFDGDYAQLFDAIILCVTSVGFVARSALESGNVSEPRIDRIVRPIFESRYSIHDLSRCRGEGLDNFSRLNMPIELGIAMGRAFSTDGAHDWFALVPPDESFRKFVSNLSAYDPGVHDGSVEAVVRSVLLWLTTRPDTIDVTPHQVLEALPDFLAEKEMLRRQWKGEPPWHKVLGAAIRAASRH